MLCCCIFIFYFHKSQSMYRRATCARARMVHVFNVQHVASYTCCWLYLFTDSSAALWWWWEAQTSVEVERGVWTQTHKMIGNRLEMLFFIVTLKTSNLVSVSMRVSGWRVEPRRAQKTKEKTRKEQEREREAREKIILFFSLTNFSVFTSNKKIVGFGAAVTCLGCLAGSSLIFHFLTSYFSLERPKKFPYSIEFRARFETWSRRAAEKSRLRKKLIMCDHESLTMLRGARELQV